MYRLTDAEMSSIQAYIDKACQDLATAGFHLTVESNMAEWVALMEKAPAILTVSPAFDPRHSHVHPGNCFWIGIRTESDHIAACQCHRLYITDDVINLIRSYKMFFDKAPVLQFRPLTFAVPNDAPIISGRVSYGGGLWVHPDFRGTGLSQYTPRLARALSLRHFDVDWNVAMAIDTPGRLSLAKDRYGIKNRFPCIDGYYPPKGGEGSYHLVYMSRQELLQQISKDALGPNLLRKAGQKTDVSEPTPLRRLTRSWPGRRRVAKG